MNNLQVFENKQFGEIRVIEQGGEPWFVAADVCRALEISNSRDAVARLDEDEKNTVVLTDGKPGNPNMSIVNEPGLYTLVLGSRKPEAKAFKRWITHEVLPSIRKTGVYVTEKAMTDYQRRMIATREENIRTRKAQLLARMADKYEGTTYQQVLHSYATKELTGEHLLPLPSLPEKTLTAREVGERLGISSNMVGILTNRHGLKTEEYGAWFNDKARGHDKEVQSFRYYEKVVAVLEAILRDKDKTA